MTTSIEIRPWGNFRVLETGETYKIKVLEVSPHKRLSLQRHQYRKEYWTIISGEARIGLSQKESPKTTEYRVYFPNDSIFIPRLAWHRIENWTSTPLLILELQVGTDLREDDIERAEDDYNRC